MTTDVILIIIGIAVLTLLLLIMILRAYLHRLNLKHYEHDIYLVTIPKFTHDEERKAELPIKERLAQIENFMTSMASTKVKRGLHTFFHGRNDHFALEIISIHNTIRFYVALPKTQSDFFIQVIQSTYPHTHFEPAIDYNIFQPSSVIRGGYLRQTRSFVFPIKTYNDFDNDPLETIITTLSKVPEGSGAAIQYLLRSSKRQWHQQSRMVTNKIYDGSSIQEALRTANIPGTGGSFLLGLVKGFFGLISASFQSKKKDSEKSDLMQAQQPSPRDQEIAKRIDIKNTKPAFDVNIRIMVSAPSEPQARSILQNLIDSYGQYNLYEYGNTFKPHGIGSKDSLINDFIFRHFNTNDIALLNAEEMVSLYHLPENIKAPNIQWLGARQAPPPSEPPSEGLFLGKSIYRNNSVDIRIQSDDRRRHMYIIGQTGTGKSSLMDCMAIQDIRAGKGVCVIDPHGDLVESILGQVPAERIQDVIVFDPSDTARPLALNILEFSTPEQKTFVINELINIFDKLYDLRQTGGPMFEQYMRNTILLMMEDIDSGATLMEIPKVLSDEKFRKYKLSKTSNSVVKDFWEKEAQKAGGEAALANMVPYITSKLTQFVANDIMRPIIAQQKSSFDFRQIMDEQKILMINLSKGKIGEMNSSLLGLITVGKILMAALSRVDLPESNRKDFYLYIDEFQNYVSPSIAIILSEARKYRLNLIIAHQYISQMIKNGDTSVKDAVFGNVGTIISYRVGVEDAETMAQQFAPIFTEYDIMNIEKYKCYIRLLINNENVPAFSLKPPAPEKGDFTTAQKIKEFSRITYGRARNEIEQEILDRAKKNYTPANPLPPMH